MKEIFIWQNGEWDIEPLLNDAKKPFLLLPISTAALMADFEKPSKTKQVGELS